MVLTVILYIVYLFGFHHIIAIYSIKNQMLCLLLSQYINYCACYCIKHEFSELVYVLLVKSLLHKIIESMVICIIPLMKSTKFLRMLRINVFNTQLVVFSCLFLAMNSYDIRISSFNTNGLGSKVKREAISK